MHRVEQMTEIFEEQGIRLREGEMLQLNRAVVVVAVFVHAIRRRAEAGGEVSGIVRVGMFHGLFDRHVQAEGRTHVHHVTTGALNGQHEVRMQLMVGQTECEALNARDTQEIETLLQMPTQHIANVHGQLKR